MEPRTNGWKAALDALDAIAKGDRAEDVRFALERIARLIEASSPEGLKLTGWPWAKYGKERVYIHVLDGDGHCLEDRIFWEAGRLYWRSQPREAPWWWHRVWRALACVS